MSWDGEVRSVTIYREVSTMAVKQTYLIRLVNAGRKLYLMVRPA